MSEPLALLELIRQEIEAGVDVILTAATAGLQELAAISEGDAAMAGRLEAHLLQILEGCAFQDLTGQRLEQLGAMLGDQPSAGRRADPLLNGPALRGQGLDQTTADRLLES
ncbi:MAG: hypothetical protein KKG54_03795 [Alphaproteobacteria bacterium]|uniref:hypothetical protein n=1 Tax=Brevundimonas sp. TaxID=1871086 RepID=UPI00183FF229|nr:hypothetical protein [Brevundimonas sp.]MBA3050528.1 hypothetical protein [Brevundimonas sp.]MBU3969900.1 hypothetical protein [Alphaproteobacteria bacterium]MBU4039810.1 hypothetical protein [Alphaproteobacteria bacterium]MBU4135052.1 hypothetical protein [Alphaproteobacteria bacterium]